MADFSRRPAHTQGMSNAPHPALITALLDPAAYDHPCRGLRCIETHISWLLLTGDYVYKIKKPVNFGFLDFSSLARRKHFCEEEMRLNSRLAPQVYLQVARITGSTETPHIDGNGPAQEYAVKMRQFDNAGLFDRLIRDGLLSRQIISDTATILARFHDSIPIAEADSTFGEPAAVHHPVCENFAQLQQHAANLLNKDDQRQRFERIQQWSEKSFAELEATFSQRKRDGFIRECHGDLHLGNIVLIDGQVTPFDGIEFNANLRWIDIISEMAFLCMDLHDHGRSDLAHRLLNAWLEITGDYAGLAVLRYYQCYRAMVRAKVAALRGEQAASGDSEKQIDNYLQLAERYTQASKPALLIMHGLSGSGKSWLSQALLESSGAIRLRSDVERKRLAGLDPLARSGSAPGAGLYSAEATRRTFEQLAQLARQLLQAGCTMIVDATFIRRAERDRFWRLADALGIPFRIVHCETDTDTLRQRIRSRQREGRDASEAGLAVLDMQLAQQEPLSRDEQQRSFSLNTATEADLSAINHWINNPA